MTQGVLPIWLSSTKSWLSVHPNCCCPTSVNFRHKCFCNALNKNIRSTVGLWLSLSSIFSFIKLAPLHSLFFSVNSSISLFFVSLPSSTPQLPSPWRLSALLIFSVFFTYALTIFPLNKSTLPLSPHCPPLICHFLVECSGWIFCLFLMIGHSNGNFSHSFIFTSAASSEIWIGW